VVISAKQFSFFIAFLIFFISIYISPYYIYGDQTPYRHVYEMLPNLNIYEGFIYYKKYLTSSELAYYFIVWTFSRVMEKDILMALVNGIFAFLSMQLFIKRGSSLYISAALVLSNYYLYVLYFSAERLKFSILFFVIALLYIGKRKFYLYSFLSVMSHAQLFIMYGALIFKKFFDEFGRVLISGKIQKFFLIGLIFLSIAVFLMYNQISNKFLIYLSYKDGFYVSDMYKLLVFLLLTLYYSRNKFESILLFIPLLIIAFLLGGERINLFGYFIFLYYSLPVNRGINCGVIITIIYFAYKNMPYILKIIETGNGF